MDVVKSVNRLIHTLRKQNLRKWSVALDNELKPEYERWAGTTKGFRMLVWGQEAAIAALVESLSNRKCSHCEQRYDSLETIGLRIRYSAYCSRKCVAASLGDEHWKARSTAAKQTLLEKHGVTNVSQIPEVKAKKERAALEKYGVKNVLLDPGVQRRRKRTLLRNHGVSSPTQSLVIRGKMRATCMERYGGPTSFSDPKVKRKAEVTVAAGMKDPVKWEQRRRKTVATNLRKYGVSNPQQDPAVASRTRSASYFSRKEVQHNGRVHVVQGAEPAFIEFLKNERRIPSRAIKLKSLPVVQHSGHRVHYPDLGLKTTNGLVLFDVKSAFTLGVTPEGPPTARWKEMKAKIRGAKEQGLVEQAVFQCGGAWVVVDERTTWKQVQRFARKDVISRVRESGALRLLASDPLP